MISHDKLGFDNEFSVEVRDSIFKQITSLAENKGHCPLCYSAEIISALSLLAAEFLVWQSKAGGATISLLEAATKWQEAFAKNVASADKSYKRAPFYFPDIH
jgi:hypothetical protein